MIAFKLIKLDQGFFLKIHHSIFCIKYIIRHVCTNTSNIFESKCYTFSPYSQFPQGLCHRRKSLNIYMIINILMTKNLSTVTTMMLSSNDWVKLLITLETILYLFIRDPFLSRTEWRFYDFSDFLVHFNIQQYNIKMIRLIFTLYQTTTN